MTAAIRRATPDDWNQVAALLAAAALPLDGARDAFQDGFVAEAEGRIIGTVALEIFGDSALVRSLAVEAPSRGAGLGRLLVDTALAEARNRQLSTVYLLTTTAAAFFQRCGFTVTSRADAPASLHASVEFQSACPASATVLSIQLPSATTSV